jgi:hypothetical protein
MGREKRPAVHACAASSSLAHARALLVHARPCAPSRRKSAMRVIMMPPCSAASCLLSSLQAKANDRVTSTGGNADSGGSAVLNQPSSAAQQRPHTQQGRSSKSGIGADGRPSTQQQQLTAMQQLDPPMRRRLMLTSIRQVR